MRKVVDLLDGAPICIDGSGTLSSNPYFRVLRRLDPTYAGGWPIVGEEAKRAAAGQANCDN